MNNNELLQEVNHSPRNAVCDNIVSQLYISGIGLDCRIVVMNNIMDVVSATIFDITNSIDVNAMDMTEKYFSRSFNKNS